jgi:DNA polymerase-3 subunit delta
MVILRNKQAENFVKNPSNNPFVILLHGQDEGLISERTHALINFYVKNKNDPFSMTRINSKMLSDDADLLENEINTYGLIGDRKVVFIDLSSELTSEQVDTIKNGNGDPLIIIKAGELKSSSKIKILCDKDQNFISIPCYQLTSNDLSALLNSKLSERKLSMDSNTKQLIISSIGRNYLESLTEINKILDPFAEGHHISREHVEQSLVSSENILINDLVDCVFEKNTQLVSALYHSVLQTISSSQILIIINNHIMKLLELLNEKENSGLSNNDIISKSKPPIFFKRHPSLIRQLSIWKIEQIKKSLEFISDATVTTRHHAEIADEITERVLLKISNMKN